jgi:hypothetical protein
MGAQRGRGAALAIAAAVAPITSSPAPVDKPHLAQLSQLAP